MGPLGELLVTLRADERERVAPASPGLNLELGAALRPVVDERPHPRQALGLRRVVADQPPRLGERPGRLAARQAEPVERALLAEGEVVAEVPLHARDQAADPLRAPDDGLRVLEEAVGLLDLRDVEVEDRADEHEEAEDAPGDEQDARADAQVSRLEHDSPRANGIIVASFGPSAVS